MRKPVETKSPFGVGMMMRVAHITEDVGAMVEWYGRVFGALPGMGYPDPDYLEPEDRYMTTVHIADLCIEIIAPAKPVNTQLPVGKFFSKHGSRLHSVGYQVDDPIGLAKHFVNEGVQIAMPGGVPIDEMDPEHMYVFPRPKDVAGIACELGDSESFVEGKDPRYIDTWTEFARSWDDHPTTVTGLGHITFAVTDLAEATEVLRTKFLAEIVEEGTREELGYRYTLARLGDTLLEVAEPTAAGTHLHDELTQTGARIYGITLQVRDLDKLTEHLSDQGIRTTRHSPDYVTAEPADCNNVPFVFTSN
ncbi:VOC family protein [Rhodococcus sp. NPDC059968]|uniref:VOC family protein n=1 Tax=Rhodococcus sp. NPDC059968 TaxID=3347017 RepID=UPI0036716AC4